MISYKSKSGFAFGRQRSMSIDITLIADIIDDVRKATGKKIFLTPKDSLPLPASLVEEQPSKQIRVEFSPSRCIIYKSLR